VKEGQLTYEKLIKYIRGLVILANKILRMESYKNFSVKLQQEEEAVKIVEIDDIEQCHERLFSGCEFGYDECYHSTCHQACCQIEYENGFFWNDKQHEQCAEQSRAKYQCIVAQFRQCNERYKRQVERNAKWTKFLEDWETFGLQFSMAAGSFDSGPWKIRTWSILNDGYISTQVLDIKHECLECLAVLRTDLVMNGPYREFMWRPPPCIHIEAQGKFKQGKNYAAKKAVTLGKEQGVFEFGRYFDLTDTKDVELLLSHYNEWFYNLKYPADVERLTDFARAWVHSRERKLILDLLVHYGNRVAALFSSALSGKLTQERMNTWKFEEPQFLDSMLSVAWLFIAIYTLYMVNTAKTPMMKTLTGGINMAYSAVQSLGKVSDSAVSLAGVVSDVVDSLKKACEATLAFFQDLYNTILVKIGEIEHIVKEAMKKLLKVILVLVAFEFARTMFSSLYKDIKSWICQYLGLEDMDMPYDQVQAQSGNEDEGLLHDIFGFINLNFIKVSSETCYEFLGKLPKMVSIAKAVGWILENLGMVYGTIVEMWTGEPRPKTKIEMEIAAFYIAVAECKFFLETEDADAKHSEFTKMKVETLEIESKRLSNLVVRSEKLRPVFIGRYNQAVTDLMKVKSLYGMILRSAEERAVPVLVVIYGEPGIGKSYDLKALKKIIWQYLLKHSPTPLVEGSFHNGHLYQLNQDEEFFDGYEGQFFVDIDDLFQSKDPDVRAMTASRLIHFVSPAPHALRVAEVGNKAHVFFKSKCILTTSNLPPEKWDQGQNLKLTDVSALTTRITIAVEKTSTENYQVSTLTPISQKGLIRKQLKKEELGAIIAEAIIARDTEKHQQLPDYDLEKWEGTLSSARLKMTVEAQMYSGKGKEKVDEKEEEVDEIYEFKKIRRHREMTEEEKSKLLEFAKERQWNQSQAVILWKSFAHSGTQDLGEFDLDLYLKMLVATGISPSNTESPVDFLEKVINEATRQRNIHEKRRERRKPKGTFKEWRQSFSDKAGFIKKALSNSTWIFKTCGDSWFLDKFGDATLVDAARANPWSVLHVPEVRPLDFQQWFEAHKSEYQTTYYPSGAVLDYDYWDNHIHYVAAVFEETKPDFEQTFAKCKERTSIACNLGMMIANFALVGYLSYKIASAFMPKTAYDVRAQGQYENQVKTKKPEYSKRAQRRQVKRVKLGPVKKFSQGHGSALIDKALRNAEIIEMRVSEHGQAWEDIEENVPLASSFCLFVYKDIAIVPGHVMFGKGDPKLKRWFSLVKNGKYHCTSEEAEEVAELNGDLFLIRFPGIAAKADISRLFSDSMRPYGKTAHILPHTINTGCTQVHAYSMENKITEIEVNADYGAFETDLTFYGIPNEGGMCGTFYVQEATGQIIGIHMGGSPSQEIAYAVRVTKSDLDQFNPNFDILDPIPVKLQEAQCLEGVQVLGVLPRNMGSFVPGKTALHESLFNYKEFPLPETNDGPAHLAPVEVDGKRISPLLLSLDKFAKQKRVPPPKRPAILHDILPHNFDRSMVRVVSLEEAVYGIENYMKSIDMNTSAGYFFKKKGLTRRQLCYDEEGNKRIHPELRRAVEMRIHSAEKGLVYPLVYEETLKDEIKSAEKLAKFDTRLFSSGDFASLVVQRMYLGTFFVEFTKDPETSPIGLTMNPHSKQWGLLYSHLRGDPQEKRKCGAGDFGSYDISLKNEITEAFKALVTSFFEGIDAEVVVVIIDANYCGWHIVGILVFVRPWGTSSGSFITSMFNSFANWYLHKTAFIALFSEEEWKVVRTTFTGDDSVFSVPEKYSAYNMTYLAKFFRQHHAMVYTSPTKTDEMTVEWENLQYLKRNFVVGHAGVMAPLAKRSIANMVKWTDTQQDLVVLSSVANSVLLEAWHYGEGFYTQCLKWTRQEEKRLGMNFRVPDWQGMVTLREKDY
jgi:hypothetical protein